MDQRVEVPGASAADWHGTPAAGRALVSIRGVRKVYASGLEALGGVDLAIREGEILALLGPNGAGKTTLISTICGIARATAGTIEVDGHDVVTGFRRTQMGRKRMTIELQTPVATIPASLAPYRLTLSDDCRHLEYVYDREAARTGITALLTDLAASGLVLRDVQTRQDSLEDIFVGLVRGRP